VTWPGKHVDKTINLPKVKNSFLPKEREAEKTAGETVPTVGKLSHILGSCSNGWGVATFFYDL
jgi:hypothetical protein